MTGRAPAPCPSGNAPAPARLPSAVSRRLAPMTTRNWNTVLRLLELAENPAGKAGKAGKAGTAGAAARRS